VFQEHQLSSHVKGAEEGKVRMTIKRNYVSGGWAAIAGMRADANPI
jgi:hypothetical protein